MKSGVDIPVNGQEVAICSRSCKLSMCDGKMVTNLLRLDSRGSTLLNVHCFTDRYLIRGHACILNIFKKMLLSFKI